MYLPNLTENSLKEAMSELTAGLSAGRMKAAPIPRAIAIRYFIQSFIMNESILVWFQKINVPKKLPFMNVKGIIYWL